MFLLIFTTFGLCYLPSSARCQCYYDQTLGRSTCNTDCRDYLEEDVLVPCPATSFRQSIPLWQWLYAEIFCIATDNRPSATINYQTTVGAITFDTPSFFVNTTNMTSDPSVPAATSYAQGEAIRVARSAGDATFNVPIPGSNSASCGRSRNVNFLDVVQSSTCYIDTIDNSSYGYDILSLINESVSFYSNPSLTTPDIPLVVIDEITETSDGEINQLDFVFGYTETMTLFNATVNVGRESLTSPAPFRSVSVSVSFLNESQFNYSDVLKTGDFGYIFGQPVIALQSNSLTPEYFPVPYGAGNGTNGITPLLFGVDVISGFDNTIFPIETFLNYRNLSILAQANGVFQNDWINITISQPTTQTGYNAVFLTIYYRFIGNVNNPQNQITFARMSFESLEAVPQSGQYIFKASFLKMSDNTFYRYLQPNPRVRGIPPDTFYPFSSQSVNV